MLTCFLNNTSYAGAQLCNCCTSLKQQFDEKNTIKKDDLALELTIQLRHYSKCQTNKDAEGFYQSYYCGQDHLLFQFQFQFNRNEQDYLITNITPH